MLTDFYEAIAPALLQAISGIVLVLIGNLALFLRTKWGIELNQGNLHRAMMTGAMAALDGKLTGSAAREMVLNYVRVSVPDALKYFGASNAVLIRMAEAKLAEAAQSKR